MRQQSNYHDLFQYRLLANKRKSNWNRYEEVTGIKIINELEQFLARAEAVKGDDTRLAAVSSDLEARYNIPKFATEIEKWEENTPDADRILQAYRLILSLRSA